MVHRFPNSRIAFLVLINIFIVLPYSPGAQAFHLPVWEVGVGVGALRGPLYRGSKSNVNIYLPIPYGIYRGERVRADRDGVTGRLFDSDRIKLDMSMSFNIPVNSDKTEARKGMPDLDPVLGIGPSLNIKMLNSKDNNKILWFKLPIRASFSIGDPLFAYQGVTIAPFVQLFNRYPTRNSEWRFKLSVGPIFSDARNHNYFYQVESPYMTDQRREYSSTSGYSGSRATVTLARNSRSFFLGIFARYDNLASAKFVDSPLVETENYFIYGLAFAWVFDSSSHGAKHMDDH